MGSEDGDYSEKPVHSVYLDAFAIDKTEVTVAAYKNCIDEGKCQKKKNQVYCNWGKADRGDHPINCVDWSEAKAYCDWADKRLPTEAEWEKAARGVDERKYPWGAAALSCEYAVTKEGGPGCGRGSTWPVGSKQAGVSPYGAFDMLGNVKEWTADWFEDDYYESLYYELNTPLNPTGPSPTPYKVVRGGGWDYNRPETLSVTFRSGLDPSTGYLTLGFRCAKSLVLR